MKVCLLPSNFDGAGMYRLLFPGRELRRHGYVAAMPAFRVHQNGKRSLIEFLDLGRVLFEIDADVYVFQQSLDKVAVDLIEQLHDRGKIVVAETDDDFVNVPAYNPAKVGTDPRYFPERNRDWLHQTFRLADAVSVSTPALADVYGSYNTNVSVLRNQLDWAMWEDAPQQHEQDRRRVRVGWMGTVEWRADDLRVLQGVIGPWMERHPNVEFVAAGDSTVHDLLGVPPAQRVTTGETPFHRHDLADITACMDIGLVPLASNTFNEGKSYLKGLEYAACGIPCVATPTAEYRGFVRPGVDGFLAAKPQDWFRCLDELVADDDLRRRMGAEARLKAESLTIQEHWVGWEAFYQGLL